MEADHEALDSLEGKYSQVRDFVSGVVCGFHTGLFLYGEGGIGKSYCVLNHLEDTAKDKYVLHNSRLSAIGLLQALESLPNHIHVIEDAETMQEERYTFGVLKSALWSLDTDIPPKRRIQWPTSKFNFDFTFSGGLIIISNTNLLNLDANLRAIKTRIRVHEFVTTHQEIVALIHEMAERGYSAGDLTLTKGICLQVADFIISCLPKLKRPPDLRLIINAFRDYLQWEQGHADNDWKVLVSSRFHADPVPTNPRARRQAENALAKRIYADPSYTTIEQKLDAWHRETKKRKDAFYAALKKSRR